MEDSSLFPPRGGDPSLLSDNGSGRIQYALPDTGLALAFLREEKTAQTCTRIFNMLWRVAGPALSHLNSYPRESLGGRTPYDAFVEKHGTEGKAFLDALGIVRIPANQVTLHPFLLGQKYQRAADRAILKKNGITAKKPETNK